MTDEGATPTSTRPDRGARWLRTPRSLTRKAVNLLPWILWYVDDDGVVEQATLREATRFTREAVARAVGELVAAGLIVRVRENGAQTGKRIRVVWSAVLVDVPWRKCLNCIRPIKPVRGSRYCAACQATVGREDRSWKAIAFERWCQGVTRSVNGKACPETEHAIAYAIHRATGVPLFARKRVEGTDDINGEGVVDYMIRSGWFTDPGWATIRKNRNAGNEGEDA